MKYWSPKKGESKIGRCPWNNSDTHSPSGLLDQVFLEVGPSTKLKSNLDKIELLCSISTKYLKTSSSSTGLKWIEQKPCRHSLSVFSKIKCLHWLADSSKYYFESISSFVNRKGTKPEQINGYSKLLFQILGLPAVLISFDFETFAFVHFLTISRNARYSDLHLLTTEQ